MELHEKREELDIADRELIAAFEKRLYLVSQIGEIKKVKHLPVRDRAREKEVLSKVSSICRQENRKSVIALYKTIFKISKKLEK